MNPRKPRLHTPKQGKSYTPSPEPTFAESLAATKLENVAGEGHEVVAEVRSIAAEIRDGLKMIAAHKEWPEEFRRTLDLEMRAVAAHFDSISSCVDRIVTAAKNAME